MTFVSWSSDEPDGPPRLSGVAEVDCTDHELAPKSKM